MTHHLLATDRDLEILIQAARGTSEASHFPGGNFIADVLDRLCIINALNDPDDLADAADSLVDDAGRLRDRMYVLAEKARRNRRGRAADLRSTP